VPDYGPAAVIMDIGMPGMNGYQFAAQTRQQVCFDAVLLIALTGWGQAQDRFHSHEAGFNRAFIARPTPAHGRWAFLCRDARYRRRWRSAAARDSV
jgi:CheY-like chemotaxis protein